MPKGRESQISQFGNPESGKHGRALAAGNVSEYIGARAMMLLLPREKWLLADRGYDADWFRNGLKGMAIEPVISSRRSQKEIIPHDKLRCKLRYKIENIFARLKDWRRIAPRYDRCPKLVLSAIALAATVLFWL
ncbi:MAG: transposase [Roseicyclus sp.]|nr:transposase [Roseicyclus sp.]